MPKSLSSPVLHMVLWRALAPGLLFALHTPFEVQRANGPRARTNQIPNGFLDQVCQNKNDDTLAQPTLAIRALLSKNLQTFMKYCRFGDRRNTGRMVVAKLTALCKDAGLIEKRFPVHRVEISFSRLKPKVRPALFPREHRSWFQTPPVRWIP